MGSFCFFRVLFKSSCFVFSFPLTTAYLLFTGLPLLPVAWPIAPLPTGLPTFSFLFLRIPCIPILLSLDFDGIPSVGGGFFVR